MASIKHLISHNLPILVVILFAAFLRLYKIDGYMEFLGDQGRDVVHVFEFLTKGNLMFIGPQTSIGNMYLGPWYYYLIAPSLWLFNFNPIGPAVFVAILGIITVWLIYLVGQDWFDKKTGLFASLIFAISPVIIKYTSFSWNPNIMPFFSLLFIYCLQKRRYLLATFSFIFVLNSHYLGLLLLIPGIYILLKTKQKPSAKTFGLNIFIIVLGFLPLILFDLKHHGQNIGNIWHFFANRQETVNLKIYKAIPKLFPLAVQLISRTFAIWEQPIATVYSIVFLFFLSVAILKYKHPRAILLSVWIISGLVGFGLYKQHIYDHYFGFLFPSFCLLMGYLISKFKSFGLVLFIPILYFSYLHSHLHFLPNNQLQRARDIVSQISSDSQNQDFNLALLAKQNYDPTYRYFFALNKSPIYLINDKKTSQLYVICEMQVQDCKPLGNPEYDVAAFGVAKITKQWSVDQITIYKLIADKI